MVAYSVRRWELLASSALGGSFSAMREWWSSSLGGGALVRGHEAVVEAPGLLDREVGIPDIASELWD
eukprot:9890818-Alexandrium_andersonii.AAC.1